MLANYEILCPASTPRAVHVALALLPDSVAAKATGSLSTAVGLLPDWREVGSSLALCAASEALVDVGYAFSGHQPPT